MWDPDLREQPYSCTSHGRFPTIWFKIYKSIVQCITCILVKLSGATPRPFLLPGLTWKI